MPNGPTAQVIDVPSGITLLIMSFMAIAIYNGLELFFWIFDFFKHRRGCYFWSMICSAFGVVMFTLAQILFFFNLAPVGVWAPFISIGFLIMTTAVAMVLYSRLHLVTSARIARIVLWMVILTTLLFSLPMQILFLSGIFKKDTHVLNISLIYERLVLTTSCAREWIILGVYIFEAFRSLRPVIKIKGRSGRKVRNILIATTIIIICLDAGLLITEFQDRRAIKMTYSAFSSSIKLKMEFAILNKLINLVQSPACSTPLPSDPPSTDQHPTTHPRSRLQSVAYTINPFKQDDAHNSRAENRLFVEEAGFAGGMGTGTKTGPTKLGGLDEYCASINEQVYHNQHAPVTETHTFITPPARTVSWDELAQQPSTSSSSGCKNKVIQESKEAFKSDV